MALEIQELVWDRYTYVASINQLTIIRLFQKKSIQLTIVTKI
jgi:hypothetical protein